MQRRRVSMTAMAGRLRSPERNGVAGQSAMAAIESVEVRVDGIHSDLNRLGNTYRASRLHPRFATLAMARMRPRRVARLLFVKVEFRERRSDVRRLPIRKPSGQG